MEVRSNDTILSVVTPEGVAYSLRPAGPVPRALAFLIDSMLVVMVLALLSVILYSTTLNPGTWIYLLATFVLQWFYHVLWEVFGGGATPGKRIFGIKVVASDGSPVSPGASFIRSLLRYADSFLGLTLIGVLTMMFSPGFRRLGDWAAGTLVVYQKRQEGGLRLIAGGKDVRHQSSDVALTGEDKMNIISFARRYSRFGTERADEIADRIVPALTTRTEPRQEPGAYLRGIGASLTGEEQGS